MTAHRRAPSPGRPWDRRAAGALVEPHHGGAVWFRDGTEGAVPRPQGGHRPAHVPQGANRPSVSSQNATWLFFSSR